MEREPIIADRGEFIDVLGALHRGHVLVRVSDVVGGWTIDGYPVYRAHEPLARFGLIREIENPEGFPSVRYYRLTAHGRAFADRACRAWQQRPWHERLWVRALG